MIDRLQRRWNEFWFAPGSATTLGTCRLLFFGALFIWQLPHDFSPWGAFAHTFWMPIPLFEKLDWRPLDPVLLTVLQSVWKGSLLLSAIGWFTRPAMFVAFALGTYLIGLPHNFGQTQHFDALVVFASMALALSRAGDAMSVDALAHAVSTGRRLATGDDGEYTWPIRFVWVTMGLIFCAAGISKLRHSGLEWIFSNNFALLLLRQQYHLSDGEPLTRWAVFVARHDWLAQGLAAALVAIEALFPLAVISRYARYILVPAGVCLLIGVRVLMGPTFEPFLIGCVFWVPWKEVAFADRARVDRARVSQQATVKAPVAEAAAWQRIH